jgi:hypothetical protein
VGAGLILLALLDMGLAVLHVQQESPISNRLSHLLWRGLVGATRRLSERRRGAVLAWGIPLMIGGSIAFWIVLLTCGFGLLFTPFIHRPDQFVIKDRPPSPGFLDALYFSAVSFSTLGFGDVVPVGMVVRLLAVLEGASGLLTISLAVTYLVAVFPVITRTLTLAVALGQEMGGRADGLLLAQRYVAADHTGAFGERLSRLADELLYLGLAHSYYPLLFYVRPREVHESFVRALALVQGIVTVRYVLDPRVHKALVADPRLMALEEALLYTLHALEESIHFRLQDDTGGGRDEEQLRAAFRALAEEAEARGLAVSPLDDQPLYAYVRFRHATDSYIRAYAHSAAYDPDAVWASYDRRARDTAPVAPSSEREPNHRRWAA